LRTNDWYYVLLDEAEAKKGTEMAGVRRMRASMQKSKTWSQDFSEVSRAINDIPALEKELRAEPKGALGEYLTQLSGAFHVFVENLEQQTLDTKDVDPIEMKKDLGGWVCAVWRRGQGRANLEAAQG
jgi:hypothetical protein